MFVFGHRSVTWGVDLDACYLSCRLCWLAGRLSAWHGKMLFVSVGPVAINGHRAAPCLLVVAGLELTRSISFCWVDVQSAG